jgi:thioredoxin 1
MEPVNTTHAEKEPTRAEVDALAGATVLEFGTGWCGWCRSAQPLIAGAFESHPDVRHVKVRRRAGPPARPQLPRQAVADARPS